MILLCACHHNAGVLPPAALSAAADGVYQTTVFQNFFQEI
jgi:hypothetical protein